MGRHAYRMLVALGCLAALAVVPRARAEIVVVEDYRFAIEVTLTLRRGADELDVRRLELTAGEQEPARATARLDAAGHRLEASLRVVPRHDRARDEAVLLLEASVSAAAGAPNVVRRELRAAAGRLRLVELWRSPDGRERLVAAVVPRWSRVPRARTLAPGARPVEVTVELRERGAVVERHRLPGLAGRPVRFEALQRDQSAPPDRPRAILTLEVLPRVVRAGRVDLSVRLYVRDATTSDDPGTARPFVAETRELVAVGEPLELPLPDPGDGVERTFRVAVHL
ncbi:MAG: hypothetical protein Kow0062_06180 [Acidobacteriota bacterium]